MIRTDQEFDAALWRIGSLAKARHGTAEGKELETLMVRVHEFERLYPPTLSRRRDVSTSSQRRRDSGASAGNLNQGGSER